MSRTGRSLRWAAACGAVLMTALACGGRSNTSENVTFKGTKNIGLSIALTGQSALYGHAISQSMKLAADEINAKGGINGYKVNADILDDATQVANAVNNIKSLILQDNVVAMLGNVTSAQCQATSPIAKQNKFIFISASCNSYQLTTEPDLVNPYYISVGPNTFMEGTAAGELAAKTGAKKIFIVSPKYLFGISETNAFVAELKKVAPSATIINDSSTWYVPFPTNPRWDSTINAIQAAKPDLVYSNIFAADEINFVKQALAVDSQFFAKYPMTTLVSVDELNTLGSQYPLGMHAYMRAPFFALQNNNARLTDYVTRYRAKYNGEYPSDWAVMDYDALTIWAQAANAAKTFDADQVVKQISGHTFDSLRGYKITIRPNELQANVGETVGTTASSSTYPFPVLKDSVNLKGDDLMMPLQMVNEIKGDQCDKTAGQPNTANFALCPSWKAS